MPNDSSSESLVSVAQRIRTGALSSVAVTTAQLEASRRWTSTIAAIRPCCASARRQGRSDHDATVVERLEQAGAVILGKLSMTEGAYTTEHPATK